MRLSFIIKLGLLAAAVLAGVWLVSHGFLDLAQIRAWLDRPYGWALFLLLYSASIVLLLPGGVLTVVAGALFGMQKGVLLVSAGATIGASLAFLVSRYLLRDWTKRKISTRESLRKLDQLAEQRGWQIVLLTRLIPIIPFRLSNYVFGASGMPFVPFVIATWIGMLPIATFYVYSGSATADLAESLGDGSVERPQVVLAGLALLLAAVAVYWAGRSAWRRYAKGRM